MLVTTNRLCTFGALIVAAGFCVGLESAHAGNGDTQAGYAQAGSGGSQLQPVPQSSTPTTVQPQEAPLPENATIDGAECCGLPLCSPPGNYWLRTEYLMWWTNGEQLPPLVTTSPQGTAMNQAGVLGQPGTTILYGGQTVGDDGRSGFRTTIGTWLDCCHVWDLEFDYFSLGECDSNFFASSTGEPPDQILARPFFNVQTNMQASELTAYSGVASGSVAVAVKNYFQSAGADLSYNLCSCDKCCDPCDPCDALLGAQCDVPCLHCCRTDLLVGLRYYNLSDRLGVTENVNLLRTDPTHTQLGNFLINDNFAARNDFYGGEIGLRTEIYRGRWSFEIMPKIAMGNNHQAIFINGSTVISATGQPTQTYNSGILAGPTNSGTYMRDVFTVIPELNLELGYQLTRHWRAHIGYDIVYWGGVAEASQQVDLNLDPRNFPPAQAGGLPFPAFPGRSSVFYAQGINVGAEFRF